MTDAFPFDELSDVPPAETDKEPDTVSFSLDDTPDQSVLELIKDDGDGNLFYRDDENWVEITKDDELPGFFDKELVDVEQEKIGEAIKLFDKGDDLNRADIASLLSVKQ